MFEKSIFGTDDLIWEKAEGIIESLIINNSENEKIEINLSNGWFYKFKQRNSFKRYRLHGEYGDVNVEGIISELPKLRKKLSEHSINDIFNADEFGLLYKLLLTPASDHRHWLEEKRKKNGLLWWFV